MKQQKGFTLIELLVVVAIIGILSGIVIVGVGDSIQRARMARSQVFSRTIHSRIGMDLSGWWSFENNALDRSGWGNEGTIMDGAVVHPAPVFEPGVFGNALRFDGVNDFVNVPNHPILNPTHEITVEGWVFLEGPTGGIQNAVRKASQYIIFWIPAAYNRADVVLRRVDTLHWDHLIIGHPRDFERRWSHIVMTYISTTGEIRGHVNGLLVNSMTVSPTHINVAAHPLTIGSNLGGGEPFRGLIDEPRIYRAAMRISYIQKRYVQGIKDLAANGGITQEEKDERIAQLRNSDQLAIDLDAALAGNIDFSQYAKYLVFEK